MRDLKPNPHQHHGKPSSGLRSCGEQGNRVRKENVESCGDRCGDPGGVGFLWRGSEWMKSWWSEADMSDRIWQWGWAYRGDCKDPEPWPPPHPRVVGQMPEEERSHLCVVRAPLYTLKQWSLIPVAPPWPLPSMVWRPAFSLQHTEPLVLSVEAEDGQVPGMQHGDEVSLADQVPSKPESAGVSAYSNPQSMPQVGTWLAALVFRVFRLKPSLGSDRAVQNFQLAGSEGAWVTSQNAPGAESILLLCFLHLNST